MADPQNQDWFATNAPPPSARQLTPAAQDWFASNAPKQAAPNTAGGPDIASFGRTLKEAGKDLASSVGGMAYMVTRPNAAMLAGLDTTARYYDAYHGAREAADRGDTAESMVKSAAVPFAPLGIDEIYNDAKSGNNEAAVGKGASRILQVAGPEVLPHVLPETMPKVSLPEGGDLAAKAKAVGQMAGREVTGRIPVLNRFDQFRKPTFNEWFDAFNAKADPTLKPEFASDQEIMDRVFNPESGIKLPSATSLPSRQLPRGAIELPQGEIQGTPSQRAIIEAESQAKAVPGEPTPSGPSTIPRIASGEGVLNQALTSMDNKSLLKIAKSRGIDVARESQLKPGAANSRIIKKIIDDFSPDELDEIRNMGMEIGRNAPVQNPNITPEAAAEAWHYKVLNQFFPDVAVPKTMAARAQATIANRTFSAADVAKENFSRARAAAEAKANAVPVDDLQGGHAGGGVTSVEELNRPGVNYVVSKSGQLTYQGKAFAPESAPSGATHVTVLPDGSFRVNAGPQLNAAQTGSLKFALKKQPWLTKTAKAGDD